MKEAVTEQSGIVVFEPVRRGIEHVPFNAAFLVSLRFAYPDRCIDFFGESDHLILVREAVWASVRDTINFHPVEVPDRRAATLARLMPDGALLRTLRDSPVTKGTDTIVLTSITASLLWVMSLPLNRKRWKRALGIIHAMPFLIGKPPRFKPRFLQSAFQFALQMRAGSQCKLVVLEKPIAIELEKICPIVKGNVFVIDHPIPLEMPVSGSDRKISQPVKVGFLGLATPQKGFDRFVEWAERIYKEEGRAVEFHVVGRLHDFYRHRAEKWSSFWAVEPSDQPLSRENYLNCLKQLDYVFFFPEGRHYDVTASGIVLDCVAHGIPLITNQNKIAGNICDQVGEIGLMLKETTDWIDVLTDQISATTEDHYKKFQFNLSKVKKMRSPEQIGLKVRELIDVPD